MRGEELQLLGASETTPSGLFVIPGTHSKWASIRDARIEGFLTAPTGEIFDLLRNHSLIGALAQQGDWDAAAFGDGVQRGFAKSQTLSDLFSARARVLLGEQNGPASRAWLSGLLIGSEIREGLQFVGDDLDQLVLIGAESLCRKYLDAFDLLNIEARIAGGNVTLDAYRRIIRDHPESA